MRGEELMRKAFDSTLFRCVVEKLATPHKRAILNTLEIEIPVLRQQLHESDTSNFFEAVLACEET